MSIRTADAECRGNLAQGSGHMRLGSGDLKDPYGFRSPMGHGRGASPEELLGAAHAACFSMALALQLTRAGFPVKRIHTTAKVHFDELSADGPFTGSISTRKLQSPISQRRPSRKKPKAPRRTARSHEPCPESTSICEPQSSDASASGAPTLLCLLRVVRPRTSLSEEAPLLDFTLRPVLREVSSCLIKGRIP
jgi:OsmC subfamily peroxiredoxin